MLDENPVISVTGFTEAADKSYDFVQEGKVYYLSKASVVLANKRFSALPNE
jgi:replication factor A1